MRFCNDGVLGTYFSMKFTDIYNKAEDFIADRHELGIEIPEYVTDNDIKTIFYLLYARYGNSHIASNDVTQFKYKVFSIIYSRAPTWKKRMQIQDRLRDMDEATLISGAKQISNHAYNPSTEPATSEEEALPMVNEQNMLIYKKSLLDGYTWLSAMLKTDVTTDFINQFKVLFIIVASPQNEIWCWGEEDDVC